ncbi:hypothetical protein [Agrococcus sp. Ld7]|uniref:hypothetical protein n=1 Tax=Agrococcus sp. Ld7 TaxID=649148 RepID=UPI0038648177
MRADATHRFEFEVSGGSRPPFVCLARTRAEAQRVALHARAPVRLTRAQQLGPDEGDAQARQLVSSEGLLAPPWRDDVATIVQVLDHVRLEPDDSASIIPAAFLPADEIVARGLSACGCGWRHAGETVNRIAVEPTVSISVAMVTDGGWQLHLWSKSLPADKIDAFGWERCAGGHPVVTWMLNARPACSVWIIASEVIDALRTLADLRPSELSCVPVPRAHPSR